MNKKTEKDFIIWINKQVDFYKPFLDINLQKITIKYDKKIEYLAMSCVYPYLEPFLTFSDEAFNHWVKGKLPRERILHELCHILTDPLYVKAVTRYVGKEEIENERERLTDTICVIITNLIEKK